MHFIKKWNWKEILRVWNYNRIWLQKETISMATRAKPHTFMYANRAAMVFHPYTCPPWGASEQTSACGRGGGGVENWGELKGYKCSSGFDETRASFRGKRCLWCEMDLMSTGGMSQISLTVTYFGELNSQRSVRLNSQLGGAILG